MLFSESAICIYLYSTTVVFLPTICVVAVKIAFAFSLMTEMKVVFELELVGQCPNDIQLELPLRSPTGPASRNVGPKLLI